MKMHKSIIPAAGAGLIIILGIAIISCILVVQQLQTESQQDYLSWPSITQIRTVEWRPDDEMIAVAGSHGVFLTDLTGNRETAGEVVDIIKLVLWDPRGEKLLLLGNLGVYISDLTTNQVLVIETAQRNQYYASAAWSPDGTLIAVASVGLSPDDAVISIWDVQTNPVQLKDTIVNESSDNDGWGFTGVAWIEDNVVASVRTPPALNRTIQLQHLGSGEEIALGTQGIQVSSIVTSPDRQMLAAISIEEDLVEIWSVESGVNILTLEGYDISDGSLSWTPDSRFLTCITEVGILSINIGTRALC